MTAREGISRGRGGRRAAGLLLLALLAAAAGAALARGREAAGEGSLARPLAAAAEALRAGRLEPARRTASLALETGADAASALAVRACASAAAGNLGAALRDLERWAEVEPLSPVPCFTAGLLARAAAVRAEVPAAAEAAEAAARRWLDEAIRRAQASPSGAAHAAAAHLASGRAAEALLLLGPEPPPGPEPEEVALLRAAAHAALGDRAKAADVLGPAALRGGSPALGTALAALAPPAPPGDVREAARRVRVAHRSVGPRAASRLHRESFEAPEPPAPDLGHFLLGSVRLLAGDGAAAARSFRAARSHAPRDPALLHGEVAARLAAGDPEGAARVAEEALAAAADDGDAGFALLLLGSARETAGDDAGALAAYREALLRDPAAWPARDRAADLLVRHGDLAAARVLVDDGLAAEPGNLALRLRRGCVLHALGDRSAALAELEAAAATHPTSPAAQTHLGRARLAAGRPAEAADCFARAVRLDPAALDPRVGLLSVAAACDALDAHEEALRSEAAAAPRDPLPRFLLGAAAELRDDPDGAVRRYLEALERSPRFGWAANNLAWALGARLGRPTEGLPWARLARRVLPLAPQPRDTEGWLLHLAGRSSDAEPLVARARASLPQDAGIALRHAEILWAVGRPQAARTALDQALALDPAAAERGDVAALRNRIDTEVPR